MSLHLSPSDLFALAAALFAILLVGSTHLRVNINLFRLQVTALCIVTALDAYHHNDPHLYVIAALLFTLKAVAVPAFLQHIVEKVHVHRDSGTFLMAPLAMHLSLGFLIVGYLLSRELPVPLTGELGWPGATASISLVCTGLLVMMTRRIALSQVIGFLVMENGIYLFGVTQTTGMPLLVEMGILLDVLVGVMIAGLIAFRIQKSFEHIDVTMLAELKE
jgi:hydrogenase-4 component E